MLKEIIPKCGAETKHEFVTIPVHTKTTWEEDKTSRTHTTYAVYCAKCGLRESDIS